MKNKRTGIGGVFFLILVAIILVAIFNIGVTMDNSVWELKLVKEGHAIYYFDEKANYEKKFKLLTKEEMCLVEK